MKFPRRCWSLTNQQVIDGEIENVQLWLGVKSEIAYLKSEIPSPSTPLLVADHPIAIGSTSSWPKK